MQTMSISALELLEEAEFPPRQARAIAKAIEADFSRRLDILATRSGLSELRAATQRDISGLGHEFSELRHEFSELRAEIKSSLAQLETRMLHAQKEQLRWVIGLTASVIPICCTIMFFLIEAKIP